MVTCDIYTVCIMKHVRAVASQVDIELQAAKMNSRCLCLELKVAQGTLVAQWLRQRDRFPHTSSVPEQDTKR